MADVKNILDTVDKIKNGEEQPSDGLNRTRGAIAAVIIGSITGLMIGYSRKFNLFYSAILGGVIGGVITAVFTPNNNK